ncbi:MauE/DoxX family redox-associated membrane protein [Propionibacteriaceae bacterium G1746]|uniref:MauE/DoxX family redox-associated membrane protein n=1 Tax=Aestuariimicrobium sp. G57 TaxID=3418485 RepID=UPI003C1A1FD3
MLEAFGLAAPLVIAAVLALSAAAKLRSPQPARDSFTSLRLPRWLTNSAAPAMLPWGELVLAVALLVLPGWWGVAAAVAALVLMLVYLVVIVRALGFDEPVECGCFGELGLGEVDRRTAWRNVLLVAFSAAALVTAVTDGRAVVVRWWQAGADSWGWLLVAICVVALVVLVIGDGRQLRTAAAQVQGADTGDGEPLDYLRTPIPFAEALDAEGHPVHLRALAAQRAQLLIFLSTTCASCLRITEQLPEWVGVLEPFVQVRPVFGGKSNPDELGDPGQTLAPLVPTAIFDQPGVLARTFQMPWMPSAVLLGADGMLAGGPANGEAEVVELVESVAEQISEVRASVANPAE